jgi:hypothetical protein
MFTTAHYQRMVVAYHGADEQTVRSVLLDRIDLQPSHNDYDWLGSGIYFWEHGPKRAFDWVMERSRRAGSSSRARTKPAVIGAYIQLGLCFDLLDTEFTGALTQLFPEFEAAFRSRGEELPKNLNPSNVDRKDYPRRLLDCAMLNWCLDVLASREHLHFQTVRAIFAEGDPVFRGSKIMSKSHIQIAVRDPSCIVGYFRPKVDF